MSIKQGNTTVLQDFVNIPITSTINKNSTNDECAGAKAVFDIIPTDTHIKEVSLLGEPVTDTTKYGADLLYFPCGVYIFESNAIANNFINAPVKQAGTFYVTSIVPNKDINNDAYVYRNYRYETYYGVIYTRSLMTGSLSEGIRRDSGWKLLCATKVQNIPVTEITLDDTKFTKITSSSHIKYCVYNGYCTIHVDGIGLVNSGTIIVCSGLPKSIFRVSRGILQVEANTGVPTKPVYIQIVDDTLSIYSNDSTGHFWGDLVYKVAES